MKETWAISAFRFWGGFCSIIYMAGTMRIRNSGCQNINNFFFCFSPFMTFKYKKKIDIHWPLPECFLHFSLSDCQYFQCKFSWVGIQTCFCRTAIQMCDFFILHRLILVLDWVVLNLLLIPNPKLIILMLTLITATD